MPHRVAVFLLLVTLNAGAGSLPSTEFQYNGGKLGYLDRGEIYSAWNPGNSKAVHKPGMKVMFFGRAQGCDSKANNGPVISEGNSNFDQAEKLTGIPLAPKGQQWTPSANTEQCDAAVRKQSGDSFVHANEVTNLGGIGMFTSTGPDMNGEQNFFQPIGASGKNGTGVNGSIEGTFATFMFDWKSGNAARPWAGDAQADEDRKAIFKTAQSVSVVSVGEGVAAEGAGPIQAKQQFIIALVNQACINLKEEKN
jgi:hypothetical protein